MHQVEQCYNLKQKWSNTIVNLMDTSICAIQTWHYQFTGICTPHRQRQWARTSERYSVYDYLKLALQAPWRKWNPYKHQSSEQSDFILF